MVPPTADEYFKRIHQMISLLDANNIKIIRSMKKHGPRNLQVISRDTGIPYPTVFARVTRLEKSGAFRAWADPDHSKIGLSRAMVLLNPTPGMDVLAREALKIPGYWTRMIRCMGEYNGFYSIHAVPSEHRLDFEQYLDQLVPLGLASKLRIQWLGEQSSNLPNFDFYEPGVGKWKFSWEQWLQQLTGNASTSKAPVKKSPRETADKHEEDVSFDKRDLIILKELSRDARMKLADFARMFKITLPAAKYRFDKIKEKGLINEYVIDLLPYSPELSDMYEVRLDFRTEAQMQSKTMVLDKIPFILHRSPVRGTNSVMTRVYLPRGEMNNLATVLSSLVRKGVLHNYWTLWLDPATLKTQTYPHEYWDDSKKRWDYDNRIYSEKLHALLDSPEKTVKDSVSFQPMSIATIA